VTRIRTSLKVKVSSLPGQLFREYMVTVKKSVVEVALEMVQEDIRHQSLPLLQHMQGSSDAISNKKGMDSAKLPKDQVFLKVWRPYHATTVCQADQIGKH